MNLRNKLLGANLLFKILFVGAFMGVTPFLVERINLFQTDDDLVAKREQIIDLISQIGIEPFLSDESSGTFGSYNLLKEEFISIEPLYRDEAWNHIDIERRRIDHETITYRVLKYTIGVDGKLYLIEIGKSLSSISLTERHIRKITFYFLLAFLSISVVFELFYTDWMLRPLKRIIVKLKSTSSPETFQKIAINTSTYDFRLLDDTLSELMAKADMLLKKEKEITQNISHELLTPISILRGKLENLLLDAQPNEEMALKLNESLDTLHRLKSLVSSLLLIARIESKQYLKQEEFDVTEIIDQVVEELQPMADEAEVKITRLGNHKFKVRSGNRSLMFSMFYNVINNAIKFSNKNGVVMIDSKPIGNSHVVTVSDTGNGIPPEQLPLLYDRFRSKKRVQDSGTGIGLAIVKSIADFHGIDIHVASTEKHGTCFSFSLLKH